MLAVVFGLLSFVLSSFGTVSVTNHAGHVVFGELTSVTNGTFTVGGRNLPLKVLPAAEQRRLKALAGQDVRTAKERQRAKMLDYELRRIDVRLQAGEITETEAAALRADARAAAAFTKKSPKWRSKGSELIDEVSAPQF